ISTRVASGGSQVVSSGGTAIKTIVSGGTLSSGGTTVSSGGTQLVSAGGSVTSTTVESGGHQVVEGFASGTLVSNGGTQFVSSGGTAIGTVLRLSSGGGFVTDKQVVGVSGLALGTIVSE